MSEQGSQAAADAQAEGTLGEHFPRRLRLLKRGQFQRVFDQPQCKSVDDKLLMLAAPNGLDHARLGLVISKRNIRTAVGRNRIKRLIRESFRRCPAHLGGLDVIVLSRRDTGEADNHGLRQALNRHWRRLAKRCANSSSS